MLQGMQQSVSRHRSLGAGRAFDVQITSRRWTFIQLSHCTMWPLYVSPFFSSTSCCRHTWRVCNVLQNSGVPCLGRGDAPRDAFERSSKAREAALLLTPANAGKLCVAKLQQVTHWQLNLAMSKTKHFHLRVVLSVLHKPV